MLPFVLQMSLAFLAAFLRPGLAAGEGESTTSPGPTPLLLAAKSDDSMIAPTKQTRAETGKDAASGQQVNWRGLTAQASLFLSVMHGFRLATEPGTRSGMKGSFFHGYANSVRNLHGWADGDPFYVNYVGHPMQGAVSNFIWAQNDSAYVNVVFGRDPRYWKSRLRGAGFAWAFSTQFEIGPLSEASIGKIQSVYPQQGFVDHVVTPLFGLAWAVGEDALDRYLVRRIELASRNPWARRMARAWLNPARSFANLMRGEAPWHRDNPFRFYGPEERSARLADRSESLASQVDPLLAPLELSFTAQPLWFAGNRGFRGCLGGGGAAALRLAPSWQFVLSLEGCNLFGLGAETSGDSLHYLLGPRWSASGYGRWRPHFQIQMGGHKVTTERHLEHVWKQVAPLVRSAPSPAPYRPLYVIRQEAHSLALAAGAGVDVKFNRALALRVASLEYRRSWIPRMDGASYGNGVQFSTGVVLRVGTW